MIIAAIIRYPRANRHGKVVCAPSIGIKIKLAFRTPLFPWIVTGIVACLVLITGLWLGGQAMVRSLLAGALSPGTDHLIADLIRQWQLGLGWMIPALSFWALFPPRSRLKAFGVAFGCALLIAIIGSVAAFLQVKSNFHVGHNPDFDTTFSRLSLLMILGQVMTGVPAAWVLSLICLKSHPKHV
jgi:apolipoprotein N-acyltransferase